MESQPFLDDRQETDCATQVTANWLFIPSVDQVTDDTQSWNSLFCLCSQTLDALVQPACYCIHWEAALPLTFPILTYVHEPPMPTSSLGYIYVHSSGGGSLAFTRFSKGDPPKSGIWYHIPKYIIGHFIIKLTSTKCSWTQKVSSLGKTLESVKVVFLGAAAWEASPGPRLPSLLPRSKGKHLYTEVTIVAQSV